MPKSSIKSAEALVSYLHILMSILYPTLQSCFSLLTLRFGTLDAGESLQAGGQRDPRAIPLRYAPVELAASFALEFR